MNNFSDEVWVQDESCRKYHCKQMEESLTFLRLKFFYSSISETRVRRIVLGFPREIVQYISKFFILFYREKLHIPSKKKKNGM